MALGVQTRILTRYDWMSRVNEYINDGILTKTPEVFEKQKRVFWWSVKDWDDPMFFDVLS